MELEELVPLNPNNTEKENEEKKDKWDCFEDPPVNVLTGSSVETKWIDNGEKLGKLLSYVVTFVIVLGGGVVSKGCLLFMTSQLSEEEKPYCNEKLDKNRQFMVTMPQEEKIVWLWIITFTFFVPQLGTFIRSLRILLYKSWKLPSFPEFLVVFLSESCSTIGNSLLVFVILPKLDVVKGVMITNALAFVPGVLLLYSKLFEKYNDLSVTRHDKTKDLTDPEVFQNLAIDVLSILIQATAFFVWPLTQDDPVLWLISLATILISCGWWENYTLDYEKLRKSLTRTITKPNKKFPNSRYFIYLFVSIWKCVLFFLMMVFVEWQKVGDVGHLFNGFIDAFNSHNVTVTEMVPIYEGDVENIIRPISKVIVKSDFWTPLVVFIISVASTYLTYAFGKFACKTYIQGFSYAFPINLTIPVTISGFVALCGTYNIDNCSFSDVISPHLFFNSPPMRALNDFLSQQHSWIWLLWLLSQLWITLHIWNPKIERLAKTERLYVRPMYEPFIIDQDIAMNRRKLDDPPKQGYKPEDFLVKQVLMNLELKRNPNTVTPVGEEDTVTRIYACVTMWHETKEEMVAFLQSIIRLDEDQCARRIVKSYLDYPIPDYYELETHIFFDDAFVRASQDDPHPQINRWVKDLIEGIDEATSKVHEINIKVKPPMKCATPYGGRLVWTLPGKTKLIAHLKDKKKIRPKKRWSQVMYMYYVLGYSLMNQDDLDECKKTLRSHNTYILALDGDVDFQPKAVILLIDLMKKDMCLGAACGRIHPIGSGIMAWYQMFEYAVGHWMQKATEHVIGCVLCSPGCFTLFRGSALMDLGVMRKYATRSTEALHYVQFDQGEDRWLSTLLLQRGYRIEYSAASDAYTHCPEGFNEFFNQRRRWIPSTTANLFDLLMTSDKTIKINNNISKLYIVYQSFMMIGTILGPGTIFLMLIGAFVAAFQLDQWTSFLWNAVPIMIFVITCSFFSGDKIQLSIAAILSGVYSLIMMAVLVGIVLQIRDDGFLAPSSLFFFCVAGEMILVAFLHPKEFNCLKYGVVYYVTVPCMYMILIIYSVFNMNNISWGTREVTVATQAQQIISSTNNSEEKKKMINRMNFNDKMGTIARFFKRLFYVEDNTVNAKLDAILSKMEAIQNNKEVVTKSRLNAIAESSEEPEIESPDSDDTTKRSWLNDEFLQDAQSESIADEEEQFWRGLLEKYLHPIDDTLERARIGENLKDLRDKVVIAFFMLNAIFVLVVFLLTLKKDLIHLNWPLDTKHNFTYIVDINEIRIETEYLQLEPIGVVFLMAFFIILIVQFIALLIHRSGTFAQIMANTTLNISLFNQSAKNLSEDEIVAMNPVTFVKKLQKLKGANGDNIDDLMNGPPDRRPTILRLQKGNLKSKITTNDLEEAFMRRTTTTSDYKGVSTKTIDAVARRMTMVENKKSVSFSPGTKENSSGQINVGFINDEDTK